MRHSCFIDSAQFKTETTREPGVVGYDWHATSIRPILNNRVYLGQVVFGRIKTKGFFDKTHVATPEEEWVIAENTHEALVSQELWDTVHQMMNTRRRENSKGEVQPFAGLVKCANCGSSLNVSYDKRKEKYTGFSCWVYKNYGKQRCTSHAIGWKTLNELVLEDILCFLRPKVPLNLFFIFSAKSSIITLFNL